MMTRTFAGLLMALLWSSTSSGDAPLPPRCELQGLAELYVDCRALVGEQGQPGLLETPGISDRIRPAVVGLLTKAGIRMAPQAYAQIPQLRVWTEVMRNPAMPGVVAASVQVAFSDVVHLKRLPKVSSVEQGELWHGGGVGLLQESKLEAYLTQEVTEVIRSFLYEVRRATDRGCVAGRE